MEAFEGYWRKTPNVKRLVFRSMPDETTRAAALKAGDVDIVYLLSGPTAEEVKRTPGLRLAARQAAGRRLPRPAGAVGSEVAVARPARASGGELRPGPRAP